MPPDYFDVLPLHPQPEFLESLTSYLMRLAEANAIPTLFRFQPIIFPGDRQHGDTMRSMKDVPLSSFASLSRASFCSETSLQATTFYYLAQKFGRSLNPHGIICFLEGSLAENLRYCPLCLQAGAPHYILPWRFLILKGCPLHGCRLLDRCPSCGNALPFLTYILKINVCPRCRVALSTGQVDLMPDPEYRLAQARYRDLTFLLLPPHHAIESGAVGPRLAYWRKARQLTVDAIVDQLAEPRRTIQSLELRVSKRGLKFTHYLAYMDYLGLTVEQLFNTYLTPKEEGYGQYLSPDEKFQQREADLMEQVHQAVVNIRNQKLRLSQVGVSTALHLTVSSLCHYPRVRESFTQISQARRQQALLHKQQVEQALVDQFTQAMANLQAEGKLVTQIAVCRLMHRNSRGLGHYPRVKAMMDTLAEAYRQRLLQQREQGLQTMITRVHCSIEALKKQGEPVTKLAVARMLGISRGNMNFHPEVCLIFTQCPEWTGEPPKKRR